MKTRCIFIVLIVFACASIQAQPYFQQEVNYTISVKLNDVSHTLSGYETIQYINNSPDELTFLWFHLWPNAYKNNETAFALQQIENGQTNFYFARESERGYIDSLDFRVNDHKLLVFPDAHHRDICKVQLPDTLAPGDTVFITTPFHVKIPGSFSRFGHVEQAYQITQWYPKPAVYDRNGWNQMPYLDQGEFYSEYGSFDVSITLPRNYIVGATGNLVTPEEIDWLNKKTLDTTVVENFPASDKIVKTIRYQEKNIHDFAWFADKRYQVKKGEVILQEGHTVTTWAMYTESQSDKWQNALEYIQDAIRYYSAWYGDYPYQNCSAVYGSIEAGGAMEYPTITVVGNAGTPAMLEEFIMHEVGHNWFYGILGFNERRFPYLDEGLNTFSEFRYMRTKYPELKLYEWMLSNATIARLLNLDELPFSSFYEYTHLLSARSNTDQPMNLPSEDYSTLNYGMIVYYKSALVWDYLMQYTGEEKFNGIMQQFYRDWKFRHPDPADLKKAFEDNDKDDLSWLFNDLIATRERLDYAVRKVKPDKVLVKNSGQIASPLSLTLRQNNEVRQVKWFPGFKGRQWLDFPTVSGDKVIAFDSIWPPEINRKNNAYRTHGVLRWMEPLNIAPIQIVEKPDKTLIGILPAVGWNYYNKLLLGLTFYSPLLPQQTFEYQLMPMYGMGNQNIAGMGKVALNLYPASDIFQAIQFSVDARRFGYDTYDGNSYNRARGEMLITFKNADARSYLKKTLKLAGITASELGVPSPSGFMENFFITMDAIVASKHPLYPYSVALNLEKHNDYLKSSIELKLAQSLRYAKNAIQVRVYASGFMMKEDDFDNFYALQLSGVPGIHDYKYEHLYLGRLEQMENVDRQPFLSQQFVMNEGGFISNNPYAYSDKWLTTVGLMLRIPKIPVTLYSTAGSYSGAGESILYQSETKTIRSENIAYEAGAMINLGSFVRVYFPFVTSRDISEVNDLLTVNYWQTIRYCIDFNAINPFKLKNTIF